MSFRFFFFGLIASFGLPWLLLILIPFMKMRSLEPYAFDEKLDGITGVYETKRSGRVADGSLVYAANSCYVCHSQLIRPTYAGTDLWREDWAGQKKNADDQDTRRESNVFDYAGESFAHIGLMRVGPDLSNVAYRIEAYTKDTSTNPEEWLYKRLLNPRGQYGVHWSTCSAQPHLFEEVSDNVRSQDVYERPDGTFVTPRAEARALVSYLLSLKKDQTVPFLWNYKRDKKPAS